MPSNEDPGACIVVIGIVMAVADWIIFETGFLIFVGIFIVFIGIASSSSMKRKASSRVSSPQINNNQNKPQLVERIPQEIKIVKKSSRKTYVLPILWGKNGFRYLSSMWKYYRLNIYFFDSLQE